MNTFNSIRVGGGGRKPRFRRRSKPARRGVRARGAAEGGGGRLPRVSGTSRRRRAGGGGGGGGEGKKKSGWADRKDGWRGWGAFWSFVVFQPFFSKLKFGTPFKSKVAMWFFFFTIFIYIFLAYTYINAIYFLKNKMTKMLLVRWDKY